jgi:hypothetical protein
MEKYNQPEEKDPKNKNRADDSSHHADQRPDIEQHSHRDKRRSVEMEEDIDEEQEEENEREEQDELESGEKL